MTSATLTRGPGNDDGTPGRLVTPTGLAIVTGELPDRANAKGISRINAGIYRCKRGISPHNGPCYFVLDVPGHENIEIHVGNFCGDVAKGLVSNVLGCILPGMTWELFAKGFEYKKGLYLPAAQHGVTSSHTALQKLFGELGDEFELTIARAD